ncbi:MAG: hypothetical protein M1405_02770 [Patescibacteria group bacterium]|nr:hypothetical protein [Patescibacteria group bacterium]
MIKSKNYQINSFRHLNIHLSFAYLRIGLLSACLFAYLLIGVILAQRARAQETFRTYTISPPTVSQKLDPGQTAEGTLKVINDTDHDLTFTTAVKDFIVEDTIGTPVFLPNNSLSNKYSAAAWLGVTPDTFTIKSRARQELNYFIQVPKNARPGGHYAAVLYTPATNVNVGGTGATVVTQAGSLFYITVKGPIKESATVTKFFANGFQEYGPVKILTQIKNFGDLHIRPQGYITVSDMLGRKAILPLKENNIFPQAARDYENQFGGKLMIGRFKAELLASYGVNNNLPLASAVYFWVFPWKIAVIVILVIIALILGSMYYRKNGFKKPSFGKKSDVKPSEKKTEAPETPEAK